MSLQIVKFSSEQGTFSANRNRVDINLPNDGSVYDLSKSYFNFNISATTTATNADAVYDVGLSFNESNRNGGSNEFLAPPTNAVLINNADMISQSKGKVETVRNVACLRSALALYEKDKTYLKNDLGNFKSQQTENVFTKDGINEIYNTGSVASRQKSMDLRINLNEVYGAGVIDAWDTSAFGNTKFSLECNFDKLGVHRNVREGSPFTDNYRNGGTNHGVCDPSAQNNSGGAVDQTSIVTANVYNDPEDSPYHVSQLLTITFTSTTGGAGQTADVLISSIEHQADGKMKLNFSTSFKSLANTDTISAARVVQKAPTSVAATINSVELIAYRRDDMTSGPSSLQWTAFESDFDTYPAGTSLDKQYYLPPNCLNLIVAFPNPIYSMEPITTYRITLDGHQTTNRDVAVDSGLHFDILKKSFINMGSSIKNYAEELIHTNLTNDNDGSKVSSRIIAHPVRVKGSLSQLGLELNASGAMSGKLVVYAQVLRKI